MNTEKLIKFFNAKLEKISEIKNLNDSDDPEFKAWWNTITSTCERMGESYKKRADQIRFYPSITFGDGDSRPYVRAFQSGVSSADAFVRSIIEELETWGYEPKTLTDSSQTLDRDKLILNLTISQQQVQQITQTINLSQYDADVQEKVQELLDELKKETKDKPKIVNLVKWLADKGTDALIAVLLAAAHLT
ncbi:hypothetical protein FJZ39_03825 [Candidatus Saccharibacteria bacterium]|nr:hypothetical protein [Candidatus Saccharibacteria bacterium]